MNSRYTQSRSVDVSTSPDINSSIEINSPEPIMNIVPRKLRFGSPLATNKNFRNKSNFSYDIENDLCLSPKKISSVSPPYRKVRALRLFDSPATPKTIIQKSSAKCQNYLAQVSSNEAEKLIQDDVLPTHDRPRSLPLHNRSLNNVMQTANVNPFSPNSLLAQNKKRSRTQFGRENTNLLNNCSLPSLVNNELINFDAVEEEDQAEIQQAPKRLALQDTNITRYKKEFVELSLIGIGEFGLVFKCLNRLDGCIYAIKRSIKPVAGSSFEKRALNEVWAHAVLGKHDNVVRYYSAWAEDNHMLIQNEFCNGGSLHTLLKHRFLIESELKTLLLHIAEGLKYIHSNNLVHMDLKSGNIFLTKVASKSTIENCDDGFEDIYEELDSSEDIITYKIGDLGHVTSVRDSQVEEGDCRYLPNEILQEDFRYLCKADIFSLGITLFEAAGGGPLPKNGPEWHKLRNGEIPNIPTLSRDFNDLIKLMTHPDPKQRPSSTSIFNHPILCSLELKPKSQLVQELTIERKKNNILIRKLKEAKKLLKSYEQSKTPSGKLRLKHYSPITSDRALRSCTRKRKNGNTEGLRDRNKNMISNIQY